MDQSPVVILQRSRSNHGAVTAREASRRNQLEIHIHPPLGD